MDGNKILQAAAFHSSFLMHTGIVPCRADEDLLGPTAQQAFAHTLFMTGEIPLYVESDHLNKAERWVSFVQGVLWDRGLIKTRILKNIMRPDGSTYSSAV